MKIGVIDEVGGPGDDRRLERLAQAEGQGYAAVWVSVPDGAEPTAGRGFFAAAHLAERTRSARVGLRSAPPASLHPLRLAEDLAVLDILAGGRLDWAPTAAAGPECLEIVLRAWRGEPFAHQGESYAFPELSCLPMPVQRPHPGLWLGPGSDLPAGAAPERTGCILEANSGADPIVAGLGRPGADRGLALICPVSAAGSAGAEGWAAELADWKQRFEPDWLLVWPEAGSGDEALAGQTQGLFAEMIADFSA
ncbi:MAG: LLM class flavin-dependent oxidoreductase [Myxococcota bacterium]|nr:LLM class flavin-dependent oxidoreductase [Myxococcota bacterium]